MNDVIWSINIMLGTLLGGVGYLIYWIFTYDTHTPNDISDSNDSHTE